MLHNFFTSREAIKNCRRFHLFRRLNERVVDHFNKSCNSIELKILVNLLTWLQKEIGSYYKFESIRKCYLIINSLTYLVWHFFPK